MSYASSQEERRLRALEYAIECAKAGCDYPTTDRLLKNAAKIEEYLKSGSFPAPQSVITE